MTWAEFHGLFMSKYFPATARHAKAQEFLELRQETMTMMEHCRPLKAVFFFIILLFLNLELIKKIKKIKKIKIKIKEQKELIKKNIKKYKK